MFVITAAWRTKTLVYWEVEKKQIPKKKPKKTRLVKWVILHSALNKWMRTCLAHKKKNKPTGRSKGSLWVCYGVGGIVLSRLRCNFSEENKYRVCCHSQWSDQAQVMVESLVCLCFSQPEWPFHLSVVKGYFGWVCLDAIFDLMM